jgi:hypothetical protein
LNPAPDGLGAVEANVVVAYLAVVVLRVPDPVVIVVVDALEERREGLLLYGRGAVDAHADYPKDIRYLVDVGRFRPALGFEPRRFRYIHLLH